MSEQEYDGYMEEEEEWDREGLLDPAWEKQQKKVGLISFTCLMALCIFCKDYTSVQWRTLLNS